MPTYKKSIRDPDRTKLIDAIEQDRGSRVIVYFTGDRQLASASISESDVRPLYEHLISVGKTDKIDLFIYSRGGDVSVPWRIVSMIREFCKKFSVLVPYKAYSAATLLALGADRVVMGTKAELGPIDPTLTRINENTQLPEEISVEDVNSYISFIREKANINDQAALAQVVSILAGKITPLAVGQVNRQNSHIRLVSRKLITSRQERLDEEKITSIIDTLTEKMYFHGHAIGRKEAKDIGLPVENASGDLEKHMWELFLEYEEYLKLNEPIDPIIKLNEKENANKETVHISDTPIAIIESKELLHQLSAQYDIQRRRIPPPPDPKISVNIALNLPPNTRPEQIPQAFQEAVQNEINQLAQKVETLVRENVYRQSPEVGFAARGYGMNWQKLDK
jgi:hypothetical protein